ncbi:MAG: hypothetical protein HY396_01505 [Candidatus Doudnabacteria bacterium]|nr:hypothetical protein [Candidatus Doudnabacteria bacterium]
MRKTKLFIIVLSVAVSAVVGYLALNKSAAPSQAAGGIKITFRPNLPKEQFLEFVVENGLRIISENLATNSVQLEVLPGEEEKYLEALRILPEVESVQFNYESRAKFLR